MEAYQIFSVFIILFLIKDWLLNLGYVKRKYKPLDMVFLGGKSVINIEDRIFIYYIIGLLSGISSIAMFLYCREMYTRSGKLIKPFTPDEFAKGILFFIIVIINVLFAMKSSKIPGIQERKKGFKEFIYFAIVYIGVTYFHLVYFNSEMGLIDSFAKTTLVYFIITEALFAYIILWIIKIFGKEKLYTNQKCYIIEGDLHYKLYVEDLNKTFLLNKRMKERYANKVGKVIYLEEIYIKSFFLSPRGIITDMW